MLVREVWTNAATGETGERWVEMPGVLTEAQAVEADRLASIAAANEAIRQQLDALDLRYGTRALTEAISGDRTRLDWLEAEKAKLRALLA